ncbi:Hsp20/alpha crystallin family protein [Cerasicoccus arenae]|uniref:Heat-shock protein Hsp20 n=1 Tax=Cerasicoccus arenae TaxID=424488 RepID=A0A8J3DL03_9BACT|nr:Hsp20/alpha crystallin family protein [Cerasicoccus arenae]MBK1857591.1 Hsp20/alpha crystallin family protein [Cerasicoccus arenae]GHC05715.1 heat-shock protein Hsp20 [Cerasicoccus arenae]
MHLIKYDNFWNDPFAEMDRLLDRTLGNNRWTGLFDSQNNATRSFRVDVFDDNNEAYQVVAELPGVDKQDVNIQLENAVLTITAKRNVKQGEEEQKTEFSRSLTISDDIDADKVTAKLEDGLLQVTLPKAAARKPKAITVN